MEKTSRIYECDIRALNNTEKGDYIVGRPIVYNSETDLGYMRELIMPGALDSTDLRDVRLLVNHNTDMIPLARSRRNTPNSTMRLIADEVGLGIEAKLDTENNATARELYSAIGRGDITGMSFMFSIDGEEWEDLQSEKPLRKITKIGRVFEVSAVIFPAYEDTSVSQRDMKALENARRALDNARAEESARAELEEAKEMIRRKFV